MTGSEEVDFKVENMNFEKPIGELGLDPYEAPAPVNTEAPKTGVAGAPVPAPDIGFVEDDTFQICKAIVNVPSYIYVKLPGIENDLIKSLNLEFYKYCVKKGINPLEYLFDEIGIVLALIPIVLIHLNNYKEFYTDEEEVDKLDKDFVDSKKIDNREEEDGS